MDPANVRNRAVDAMLSKGIYTRSPSIPMPEEVGFIKKKTVLGNLMGPKLQLNTIDISHLFFGLKRNMIRKSLFIGFGQVADSKKFRQYMAKGVDMSSSHAYILSNLLLKYGLPVTMPWDSGVLNSSVAPFSDKLMMQTIRTSNSTLVLDYAKSIAVVRWPDLTTVFTRMMAEAGKFALEGLNLMLDNGWYEQPPPYKPQSTLH